ncbi:DsrE family protein [Candidatus Thiodubiliella endoseptemdiera]|uniref:DsrE family protein n=1 Tax=Candidatus Thiodubiliella endoseptemdiera TaxID=2738886 RepID=A0A853F4D9_9GAMM|nr:DsrE family protein [Candidatus Thiodubiliella endoseptemdiera]
MKKILLGITTLILLTLNVQAANPKYVIQVSTDDARTQKIALNNAVNLQKHYGGADKVDIEIVAFGPGLGILTTNNKNSSRVERMALNNIKFSACQNTMRGFKKKKGHFPTLTDGVDKTPAGVVRIGELQQQGYSYIRP